jgi:uncharacterized membrane protein YgcG
MKITSTLAALAVAVLSLTLPAAARTDYVQDGAGMFSAGTVSNLNQEIGDFNRQTGKEVVVVTVPSLDGATPQSAAEKAFAQQQVNGVMIFLSKAEKKDGIIGDTASRRFFPAGSFDDIRQAMRGYFRTGDFDQGITTGVGLVLSQYRSHERALSGTHAQTQIVPTTTSSASFGGGMSLFWLILILIAGFLVIRAIFRAMAGPRMMPPGYGGGPGYGGPGYGGPGYGGYGGGGGGGSFFSGLLGGLGGAFLGNELFGRHDGGNYIDNGSNAGFVGGDQSDSGGWQSDPGQADMSNASFGDYGSSGGGFDSGGGGFDSGGGGGDSGGGW